MITRSISWLVVLLGLLSVSCGGDDERVLEFPNLPSGNPLVPDSALLPFPSDFYLEADPSTRTGRRVVIPQEALPEIIPADAITGDGYSMMPGILAQLPGGIDGTTLPDPLDVGATTRDDSPVFVVEVGTGNKLPALAELDLHAANVDRQAMIIRPHVKLEPNTGYVVILRNTLRTADGQPHTPADAFIALRDGIATNEDSVEAQREAFVDVNEAIAKSGLQPTEVVLAWSFHTRSEEDVVTPFVAMQQMMWEAPVGDWSITDETTDERNNRVINGLFETPNFRNADGLVELDEAGMPIQQGTYMEEFRLTIPESVEETRPVIVYGHGFFGSYDQSSRGSINQLCRERGYSAVGTTLGFNSEDEERIITILAGNMAEMPWVVSVNYQKLANHTMLAKLTREKLAVDITSDKGAGVFSPLDGSNIQYAGISAGATFGYNIVATSPAFERASLVVGGGGLSHFLQRAVQWNEFKVLFTLFYQDPIDLQIATSMLQQQIDPIDPIYYAQRLTKNRFPNLPALKVAIHMAINDSQVRNVITEWTARTSGTPLITPSPKEIWGLETVAAPAPDGATGIDSALWVYDEHLEPSPVTNLPPETDNDGHSTVRDLVNFQEQWYQFHEFGRFVQVCDGACDPD